MMTYSADEDHQWLSEGHRTMLHFGFRYNPESKEVEPFEPTPPEFIQAIGLRAFSACAQVLPSSLLCPNMWSVARYEPGSGLRSHVDVPQLGPYGLDGSFGSGAEMAFEPRPLPGSTLFKKRQKVFLQRAASSYFLGKPATNGSTKSQLATMTQWRSGAFPETPGYPLSSVTLV